MNCETCEKLAAAVQRMLERMPYRNNGVERATREVREMMGKADKLERDK